MVNIQAKVNKIDINIVKVKTDEISRIHSCFCPLHWEFLLSKKVTIVRGCKEVDINLYVDQFWVQLTNYSENDP